MISGEIRTIGEKSKVQETIKILPSGLLICDIKITNPFSSTDESIKCNALIDTGCDTSIICQSIFERFTIDESKIEKIGLLTVNNFEKEATLYPVRISVPARNWSESSVQVGVLNLLDRKGYRAIIGIDILKHFKLYSDWVQRIAWLEV